MNSIMNIFRRFITGTLLIFAVVIISAAPKLAFAMAPSNPVITPEGNVTDGTITVIAGEGSSITGYTLDGTNPEVNCADNICVGANTTKTFAGENVQDFVGGKDSDFVTVKARSYDSQGVSSQISTKDYFVDRMAPSVVGITDGGIYNGPVTIQITDKSSTEAYINGQSYATSTITVTEDGSYDFYASDVFMQKTPIYHFVIDKTPPLLTLRGRGDITVEVGTSYTELGAIASDNNDGNLVPKTLISEEIDTNKIGTYTITYVATDSAGNTMSLTRILRVVDTTLPILTLNGGDMVVNVGSEYVEHGAMAHDGYDGDISHKVVSRGSVDTSEPGSYTVYYSVTDSSGNTMSIERKVQVISTPILTSRVITTPAITNCKMLDSDPPISSSDTNIIETTGPETFDNSDTGSVPDVEGYIPNVITYAESTNSETFGFLSSDWHIVISMVALIAFLAFSINYHKKGY